MLIHIEPYDSRLAAEFVSPAYADVFLQEIGILMSTGGLKSRDAVPKPGRGR
jgi:hypothetical protein